MDKGRFKKKCGIFRTFQNPPTPLAKCGKKIKITNKFQDLADLAAIWISEIF